METLCTEHIMREYRNKTHKDKNHTWTHEASLDESWKLTHIQGAKTTIHRKLTDPRKLPNWRDDTSIDMLHVDVIHIRISQAYTWPKIY